MSPSLRRVIFSLIGVTAFIVAGCSNHPTFPRAQVASALQQFLSDDHVKASVRLLDHTLGVQVTYPGALMQNGNQVGIGPAFDDVARKVLTQVHRVLLSSDADVWFYVLLISDPQTPGAYLTMVRYMDDVRRANANMIDTPEMFARTVFELNMAGPEPLTIDQYIPRDIQLEEFLSWQLARRIQYVLAEDLQSSGAATVGRCGGEFRNGEFAFTLDVTPATNGTLDDATLKHVFQESTNVIAKVLSSYHFNAFKSIRLIHPPTGRNLVLPKTSLHVFR